ncbi:DUF2797 domain-containing protein [Arthrobacter sp. 08Y14]|uniref:DUF2797 domain-containing protein n=1 Tax=Arthrobacter sp. 08Y14 TaxID=2058885 RepID=UPI0015E3F08E|nr:DUF2797 domain-containing protein [Arthrobacter sp. 08Y14]
MTTAPGRYLSAGVSWDDDGPYLALRSPVGVSLQKRLNAGTVLSYRVLPGEDGALRHCLGSVKVQDRHTRIAQPCPEHSAAERGYQCGPCFARDDWRLVHNVHRSGIASPGLQLYLEQPHWLYVATFADGTSKVGTAAAGRKRLRLVEQGAVAARYVARADDGRVVRILEDLVAAEAGLVQAVRAGTKAAALAQPLAEEFLDRTNSLHAAKVRELLTGADIRGFSVVAETWERPAQARVVLDAAGAVAYPLDPGSGEHAMVIEAMVGAAALVTVEGSDTPLLADLARLKGRRLNLGAYQARLPALQTALF